MLATNVLRIGDGGAFEKRLLNICTNAQLLTGDVRLLPLKGFPLYAYWRLIWLKGKKFSPASQAFLASIRENKQSVFDGHFAWARQYINKVE